MSTNAIVSKTTEIPDNSTKFLTPVDITIAVLATCLILAGMIGNSAAFIYFIGKKIRSAPIHLYTIITFMDLCMAVMCIPVVFALLNYRRAGIIFQEPNLCLWWSIIIYSIKRMSGFLVMMMSLKRAFATVFPLQTTLAKIRRVTIAIAVYAVFIAGVDRVLLSTGWFKTRYRVEKAMCEIYTNPDKEEARLVHSLTLQAQLLLPSFVVLISLFVCSITLVRQSGEFQSERRARYRRVTVTIAIFAVTFLVCNIPSFAIQLNFLIAGQFRNVLEEKENGKEIAMTWYSHLIAFFFLTLFNTTVNPCLYLLRMLDYRRWLRMVIHNPAYIFSNDRAVSKRSLFMAVKRSAAMRPRLNQMTMTSMINLRRQSKP